MLGTSWTARPEDDQALLQQRLSAGPQALKSKSSTVNQAASLQEIDPNPMRFASFSQTPHSCLFDGAELSARVQRLAIVSGQVECQSVRVYRRTCALGACGPP